MAEHSDERLFRWLNQRVERVSRLTTRHPLLTGALIATATAAASVIGLAIQHRITPAMLAFCAALCSATAVRPPRTTSRLRLRGGGRIAAMADLGAAAG